MTDERGTPGVSGSAPTRPTWRIAFLFHADLDLLSTTLPRCLEAQAQSTTETFEVVLLLRAPYLIVVEDDVVMYRTERSFDVLRACRELFERHPDVPVLSKVNDYDQWSWRLTDVGQAIAPGVRSVNRLSTHCPGATALGGSRPDVLALVL